MPGTASILSMVPPVWPRPRPLILATGTPQAATMGTMTSVVLSPTPPVECLSTLTPGIEDKSTLSPEIGHDLGEGGGLGVGHAAQVDGMSSALIW